MKKMPTFDNEDMLPEYKIDYTTARSNRFAINRKQRTIVLDEDIADSFPNSAAVNEALRFLLRVTRQHQTELTSK